MSELLQEYWNKWREFVDTKKKEEWSEIQDEFDREIEFAVQNFMDSEIWCWNCKYSECEVHKVKQSD